MPSGWQVIPDPNVPDAFSVIADRQGGDGLYTSNAQLVVYKLVGEFDPREAISHGYVENQKLFAWQSTSASMTDFGGFPSSVIEGIYRETDMTLNTSRRNVIAESGSDRYLVTLTVTTAANQAVATASATDGIVNGFRVTAPSATPTPAAAPAPARASARQLRVWPGSYCGLHGYRGSAEPIAGSSDRRLRIVDAGTSWRHRRERPGTARRGARNRRRGHAGGRWCRGTHGPVANRRLSGLIIAAAGAIGTIAGRLLAGRALRGEQTGCRRLRLGRGCAMHPVMSMIPPPKSGAEISPDNQGAQSNSVTADIDRVRG